MKEGLLKGAWDVHVHCAPSLFPRSGDAAGLVAACQQAGLAGLVLKAHHGSTVELAQAVQCAGLEVLGGLVLNGFVGGLNPLAVESALALGARIVWLPTIHAAHHGASVGPLGAFSFQGTPLAHTPGAGLTLFDPDGAARPGLRDVLALLDGSPAALATGHVSPGEILGLQDLIGREGLQIRLLINHVHFQAPALSLEQLRSLSKAGAYLEVCALSTSTQVGATTAAHVAQALNTLPDARWVLASDGGQADRPSPPDTLAEFTQALLAAGAPRSLLQRALREHPAQVLGVDAGPSGQGSSRD